MRYILFVFTFLILVSGMNPLLAQEEKKKDKIRKEILKKNPEFRKDAEKDSTKELPFSERDTLQTTPINSRVFWYDAYNRMKDRKEFLDHAAYRENEEKKYQYTDISDIFRSKSLWSDYDLKEIGRQVYLGGINRFPHQTNVFFNGILMNDPVHGMFNGQFVPFNYVRQVQLTPGSPGIQNMGYGGAASVHIIPGARHTKAPWTKLVYKEGSYGYSDFELSFISPINSDLAFQLGGVQKEQDGTYPFPSSFSQEIHYRGEISWQINPNIYLKSMFYLNRFDAGLVKYYTYQFTPYPKTSENRDDYIMDLTWLPDDSLDHRLHVQFFNTYSKRRLKDAFGSFSDYSLYSAYNRYGFDANFNLFFNRFEMLLGAGGIYSIVKGKIFNKKYHPYTANTYMQFNYPIIEDLYLWSVLQFVLNESGKVEFTPSTGLKYNLSETDYFNLSASRGIRFPNMTERYFDYDSLAGNNKLLAEEHLSVFGSYGTTLAEKLRITAKTGYSFISKEIVWNESSFSNGIDRDFAVFSLDAVYPFWKFEINPGGFYMFSNINLTAGHGAYINLHYSDFWFKKALGMDIYGTMQYSGEHRKVNYEPRLERFYLSPGFTDSYIIYNWKIVATVKTARIFFEMDNILNSTYEIINQNPEVSQRWRFGVHWLFWD